MITVKELQAKLDKTFHSGARVEFPNDYVGHTPRIMVDEVTDETTRVMVWLMDREDQPLFLELESPLVVHVRMREAEVDYGWVEFSNKFPEGLVAQREEYLTYDWFKDVEPSV